MAGTALGYAILGGVALFAPDELAWRLGAPATSALLLQLLAAAYLSMAALDWIGRRAIYGGIYGRGIVVANFTHGFIGATVMVQAGLRTGFTPASLALTVLFAGQGIAFGWLMMAPPRLPEDRGPR